MRWVDVYTLVLVHGCAGEGVGREEVVGEGGR